MEVSRLEHTSSGVRDLHFGFPQRSHNLTYDMRVDFDKSWMGIGALLPTGVQLQTQLQWEHKIAIGSISMVWLDSNGGCLPIIPSGSAVSIAQR
jgi:hypothetical protein